jgi:hypothetical protein
MNIYYPLKEDLTIDKENRVYLVIKPEEIKNYKLELEKKNKKTKNASSRWVSLLDIQEAIKSKTYTTLNRKKNVYLVH